MLSDSEAFEEWDWHLIGQRRNVKMYKIELNETKGASSR